MKSIILCLLLCNFQSTDIDKKINFHNEKADMYYHIGNFPNMLYHLKEKIKLDPKDTNTYADIAYYYWSMSIDDKDRRKEFLEKAEKYLFMGLENNKNTSYMWDEIGNFYYRAFKDYDKSVYYLKKSIEFSDSNLSSYHSLSLAYLKLHKTEDAIKTLEKCVKKFPNDEKGKSKLRELKNSLKGG